MIIIKLLKGYWNKQTPKEKRYTAIIWFLVVAFLVVSIKLSISEYRRLKGVETQYNTLIEARETSDTKIDNSIKKGTQETTKTQKRNIAIDKKLKQDEDKIDNSDVTDDSLKRYISKHQKR